MPLIDLDQTNNRFTVFCSNCATEQTVRCDSVFLGYKEAIDQIVLPKCSCGWGESLLVSRKPNQPDTPFRRGVNMLGEHLRTSGRVRPTARKGKKEDTRDDKKLGHLVGLAAAHDYNTPAAFAPNWNDPSEHAAIKARVQKLGSMRQKGVTARHARGAK